MIIAAILIILKRGKGQKNPEVSEPSAVDMEDSAASPETAGEKDPASAFQPAGGIYMRVEAKEGVLSSEKSELTLDHELTAGRDPSCDIVLLSEEIPPKAVRIFIEDGPVYIEGFGIKRDGYVKWKRSSRHAKALQRRPHRCLRTGIPAFLLKKIHSVSD